MKKALLFFFTFLVLLLLAVLFFGPNYAAYYLEKNGEHLLGRKLKVADIDVNIFNGHLRLKDVQMYENNDSATFVHFDELYTDLKLYTLFEGVFFAEALHIKGLHVHVWRKDRAFNYADLLSTDNSPKDTTKSSFIHVFTINDIQVINSEIIYDNFDLGANHDLRELNFTVPGITFGKDQTSAGVDFSFAKGGKFHVDLDYDAPTSAYTCNATFSDLNIAPYMVYAQSALNITDLRGVLHGQITVSGNAESPANPLIKGKVRMNDFSISMPQDSHTISLDSFLIEAEELNLAQNYYHINKLDFAQLHVHVVQDGKQVNLQNLLVKNDSAQKRNHKKDTASLPPLTYLIDEMHVDGSRIEYNDPHIANGPFSYSASEISIHTKAFSSNKNATVYVTAKMNEQGFLDSKIQLNPGNADQGGSFDIELKSIPIKDFSVHSINATGYPISGGILDFEVKNTIKKEHLTSQIIIDLRNTAIDAKRTDVQPKSNVPLKLGLTLLEDPKKLVHMDIPAEGNLDDPNFNYPKIIWKAVINVLIKAAASPYKMLAGTVGVDENQTKSISVKMFQVELTPNQTKQLDVISKILNENPSFSVLAQLQTNLEKETEMMYTYLAKLGFSLRNKKAKQEAARSFDPKNFDKIMALEVSDKMRAYLSEATQTPPGSANFNQLAKAYSSPQLVEKELQKVHSLQAEALLQYMYTKIQKSQFQVSPKVEKTNSLKKPQFQFIYTMN